MQGFGPDLDNYADPSLDLERYVHRRTREAIEEWQSRDSDDPALVREHQRRVREAVLAGIGGLPERPAGPPPYRVTNRIDPGDGRPVAEAIIYESLPGAAVTATLYRPAGADPSTPLPAVIFACGHGHAAKNYDRYRGVCATLAAAGLVVLAVDPHGQGERISAPNPEGANGSDWGVGEHLPTGMSAWWLGQSLMRWMAIDLVAAVDLLESLPGVDPARIGITGNSGGGTQTSIMMAIEPRLAAAAPGTYVTSRLAYQRMGQIQDGEQHLLGGTVAGVDHADLLVAFAPRPVRVLAVSWDFFTLDGTRDTLRRAERAFAALGAPDGLSFEVVDSLHSYAPGLTRSAAEFFCDAFGLPAPGFPGDEIEPLPELLATTTGQLAREPERPRMIGDLIAEAAAGHRPPADLTGWLTERVTSRRRRPEYDTVRWTRTGEEPHLFWNSEEDLWGAGVLLDPAAPSQRAGTDPVPLTLVLLPDGTRSAELLPEVEAEGPRVVLDLRGIGALTSRQRGTSPRTSLRGYDFKLLCDLLWLDDSLAAGRVYDLGRAVDVLTADAELARRWPGLGPDSPVDLVTVGPLARWYAELAALVDGRIREVRHDGAELGLAESIRTCVWDAEIGTWQALIPGIGAPALA